MAAAERYPARPVQMGMGDYFSKTAWAVALSVALVAPPACSASETNGEADTVSNEQHDQIEAVLRDVPAGELTRFILTLSSTKDSELIRKEVSTVLESLHSAGAKAEWLEGSPVIFVTSEKAAIYRAVETGYIQSVQVDKVKPPLK